LAKQTQVPNVVGEEPDEPQREERPSPDCPEQEARSKPEKCEEKNDDCGSDQDTAHIRLSDEDQEPHHCDIDKAYEYRSAADILRPLCKEVIFQRDPVDSGLHRGIEQFHDEHQ